MQTRTDERRLDQFDSLVSAYGPVAMVSRTPKNPGIMPRELSVFRASVGSGSPGRPARQGVVDAVINGFGKALGDDALARLVAIAEASERYSAGTFIGGRRVMSAASELDGPALDIGRIPRCSERELSVPGCPLRALDPRAPISWVEGLDLIGGRLIWVPTVMAAYRASDVLPSEQFWYRISTGYAVHVDPLEALVGGICEIIERDLISVLWLQRLNPPLVPPGRMSPTARTLAGWCDEHFIKPYLFDGTTDMGVPTVYCLLVAEHDDRARQSVGAATGRTIEAAGEKALMESIASRSAFYADGPIYDDFREFNSIGDGARYMARSQMAAAFDFLTDDAGSRPVSDRPALPAASGGALSWLLDTLRRKDMHAVAVDRTSRELNAAGLTAVNVVIPELQPMSLHPLAQYRAHPRLYEAPELMGYPSHPEEELNPWPLPFH